MVILTHPCAGKTYYAKQDFRVTDCPDINEKVDGEFVFVCPGHKYYDRYDAVVVLPLSQLEVNVGMRRKENKKKLYTELADIMKQREIVLRISFERNLPIFESIPDCMNYYQDK